MYSSVLGQASPARPLLFQIRPRSCGLGEHPSHSAAHNAHHYTTRFIAGQIAISDLGSPGRFRRTAELVDKIADLC